MRACRVLHVLSAVLLLQSADAQQAPRLTLDRTGRISWNAAYGVTYQLQVTARLEARGWTNIGGPIAGGGSTGAVTNAISNSGQAFYRVVATNAFACTNSGGMSCATADYVGAFAGDSSSGTFCGGTQCRLATQRSGCGNGWFRIRVTENSTCLADLGFRATLQSPPGVDYDLYVYRACGQLVGSSRAGAGQLDTVTHRINDSGLGADDSMDLRVEVRFFGGSDPGSWTLSFYTGRCE